MTTAASIWTTAGIGIALGASPRLGELGVIATMVTLATLVPLEWLETRLKLKRSARTLEIEVKEADHGPARVLEALADLGIVVESVQSHAGDASINKRSIGITRHMHLSVMVPTDLVLVKMQTTLTELAGVVGFQMI